MPRPKPGGNTLGTLFLVVLVLAVPYTALNLGEALTPTGSKISWKVRDLLEGLIQGQVSWPFASTFIAIALFIGVVWPVR